MPVRRTGRVLILDTLYGFGTYMTGLGSRERGEKVMSDYFRLPGNRFSYEFTYIASVDDKVAGLLVVFRERPLESSAARCWPSYLSVFFRRNMRILPQDDHPAG
jgi:hypothetical protein